MNSTQTSLIQSLTVTNQSLLNQLRAKDVGTLATLQSATEGLSTSSSASNVDTYESTDARELRAYIESISGVPTTGVGDTLYDDSDIESFRIGL